MVVGVVWLERLQLRKYLLLVPPQSSEEIVHTFQARGRRKFLEQLPIQGSLEFTVAWLANKDRPTREPKRSAQRRDFA